MLTLIRLCVCVCVCVGGGGGGGGGQSSVIPAKINPAKYKFSVYLAFNSE